MSVKMRVLELHAEVREMLQNLELPVEALAHVMCYLDELGEKHFDGRKFRIDKAVSELGAFIRAQDDETGVRILKCLGILALFMVIGGPADPSSIEKIKEEAAVN